MNNKVLIFAGPTAVGKTEYAIRIARHFGGEIISADSMQIYKDLNIGSAKPTPEERSQAVHHLIDFVDPREFFTAADYQHHALKIINGLCKENIFPIVSGGTGLYLNSIMYDMDFTAEAADMDYRANLEILAAEKGNNHVYEMLKKTDPAAAERLHPNNIRRVIRALEVAELHGKSIDDFEKLKPRKGFDFIVVTLLRDRDELYFRINKRVDLLMERGLLSEVQSLINSGLKIEDISMKGIGYKELFDYINGEVDLESAVDNIKRNTRRYAKRQMTWFKKYQAGKTFNLSGYANDDEAFAEIASWLGKENERV